MSGPRFSRRALLQAGLGLSGLFLLALGGGVYLFRRLPTAPGKAVLSEEEARFIEAFAEAYFPPGNALGIDVAALDLAGRIDAHLAGFSPFEQRALRALIALFDQWPRLSFVSAARFSALDLDHRVRVLRAFEKSKSHERRGLCALLRTLVAMLVFDDAGAREAIGHRFGCPAMELP